jgi:TetR/AcrR family transcriptional repressor of nem operon
MGRKKSYDRAEAAERALQAFWEKGYERTSLRDLEAATGVNRYGLYDSFTDKQGLFGECIEHYCASTESMLAEQADEGLDGLLQLIGRFAEPQAEDNNCRHGCLVVTSLLERDGLSPAIRQRLKDYIQHLLEHIRSVLANEQRAGKLRAELELDECVEFMHLFLVGLPTMSRISSDDAGMRLAARAAMHTMQSWRPAS